MSKPKLKALHARATRAWNKAFGPTPSANLPVVGLPTPTDSTLVFAPNTPISLPSLPDSAVSARPPTTPSPPLLAPTPPTPTLHIPPGPQVPTASRGGVYWVVLNTALQTLYTNAGLFPPLQSAIGGLISGLEIFKGSTRNQKEYMALALELKAMSETLDRHLQGSEAPPLLDFIVETIRLIQEQVDLVAKIQSRDQTSSAGLLLEVQYSGEALTACYGHIQALARQLQIEASLRVIKQQNILLKNMNPANLATYDSGIAMEVNRRACTENTRTGVLSDIQAWLADPNAPKVCWMNGMAGTGKTTIAYTLAQALEKTNQLGASFFCTRTTHECRDVSRIVPSIAYQLARHSAPFLSALCHALDKNPPIQSQSISTQFDNLLNWPLRKVLHLVSSPYVVVIDALDECTASQGVEMVLDLLFRKARDLPIKFFVTSRPEPTIRSKIQEQPEYSRLVYELHKVERSDVQADIESFIQTELPSITRSQVKQLARQSGVLFIYAATAIRYIRAGNIEDRLAKILSVESTSRKGHAEIDQLYTAILSGALDIERLEEDEEERMKLVLWTVVCAHEPIGVETLAVLTGIPTMEKVLEALEPLRSVVYVSEDCKAVSILHASFPDYMFNPARSTLFYCNSEQHQALLARRCFELMQEQLHFNICKLQSSYVPDTMVPNLEEHVNQIISPTLAYVCRCWADHLRGAAASETLHALLAGFLSERLLFWMEVMSLKHCIGLGIRVILSAKLWIMFNHPDSELLKFAEDARNFVIGYASNAISQCTPHIYVSALTFCRRSNEVYKHYWPATRGMIEARGASVETRRETIIATWEFDSEVGSVAYSPDGTRIVVGCYNGTVIIQDAHDGIPIGAPLRGHTACVSAVAFSVDGSRIISGSDDGTVRVWNALDGTAIGAPFQGHISDVVSVVSSTKGTRFRSGHGSTKDGVSIAKPINIDTHYAWTDTLPPSDRSRTRQYPRTTRFTVKNCDDCSAPLKTEDQNGNTIVSPSPDSTLIASSPGDGTICIQNAQDPFTLNAATESRHKVICAIAFSPEGGRIVSGASDGTICIWNAQDGTPIGAPFEGHIEAVRSVVFSSDGTRVLSSSNDLTVRIWNAQHGGAPLWRRASFTRSVAFSPNSTRIVSGCYDGSIRIWDVKEGTPTGDAGFFRGHTKSVMSVAFSPDGMRIISGSEDRTVRVWNARDGTLVYAPLRGHTNTVSSVAYSPDGARIISGSHDETIRLWNAHDGVPICEVLRGHTGAVNSVACSPDGKLIVSGSGDKTVRIWAIEDGTPIGSLEGHTGAVMSVAFSPDGKHVVSGSDDNTIRAWILRVNSPIDDTWSLAENGWIMGSDSRLLAWIPPDIIPLLPTPQNLWVIGPRGSISIDYSNVMAGSCWHTYYSSQ